jgi:predicted amidohydrolase
MGLTVAAAQSASVPGDVARNVAHHLQFAALAAERGVQLLVFPELSLIGYELSIARTHVLRPDSPELLPLLTVAKQAQMTIVAGAPLRNDNGQLEITALILKSDGSVTTYAKEHVHESEQHVFSSGSGGALLRVEDANVGLAICADATHPEHAAKAAAAGADVYAVGAMIDDNGYPRKSRLLREYASQHRMAVLMANYSGVTGGEVSAGKSALWSDKGDLVAECTGTDEALVIGTRRDGKWTGAVLPVRQSVRPTR